MDYYQKYLKYKTKYLDLKEQLDGAGNPCKGKNMETCKLEIGCKWRTEDRDSKGKLKKAAKCKQIMCKKETNGVECSKYQICKWNEKKKEM